MTSSLYFDTVLLLDHLDTLIQDTENRLILNDPFIINNINLLTNSCIVLACTYLESYLRDAFWQSVNTINSNLDQHKLADNIIRWSILKDDNKKLKLKDNSHKFFSMEVSEESVDWISANIEKTLKVFWILGINLDNAEGFSQRKDEIANFIEIRNLIIHRNRQSSITPGDLRRKIEIIKGYMNILDEELTQRNYLPS